MNAIEVAAADYIVSLWGRKRRSFARRYWFHVTRGMPRPNNAECFGAARIADRLMDFAQAGTAWDGFYGRH